MKINKYYLVVFLVGTFIFYLSFRYNIWGKNEVEENGTFFSLPGETKVIEKHNNNWVILEINGSLYLAGYKHTAIKKETNELFLLIPVQKKIQSEMVVKYHQFPIVNIN